MACGDLWGCVVCKRNSTCRRAGQGKDINSRSAPLEVLCYASVIAQTCCGLGVGSAVNRAAERSDLYRQPVGQIYRHVKTIHVL